MPLKTDGIWWHSLRSVFRMQRAAVGYRIPKPVVRRICYGRKVYPVCPRCACGIDREYTAFCDRCGQRLGWGTLAYAPVTGQKPGAEKKQ